MTDGDKKRLIEKFKKLTKLEKYEILNDMSESELVYNFSNELEYWGYEDIQVIEQDMDIYLGDKDGD